MTLSKTSGGLLLFSNGCKHFRPALRNLPFVLIVYLILSWILSCIEYMHGIFPYERVTSKNQSIWMTVKFCDESINCKCWCLTMIQNISIWDIRNMLLLVYLLRYIYIFDISSKGHQFPSHYWHRSWCSWYHK